MFTSIFPATATPHPNTKPSPIHILVGCGAERSFAWLETVVTSLCIDNKNGKPDLVFVSKLKFQILTQSEETDAGEAWDVWAHFKQKQRGNRFQTPILGVYIFVLPSDS